MKRWGSELFDPGNRTWLQRYAVMLLACSLCINQLDLAAAVWLSRVLRRSAAHRHGTQDLQLTQKSPVLAFVYVLLQELLHHVHDGHHISEPDRDSHGDSVSGRTQRTGVGGLQRVFRHAVPDRCGSEFPNGHHYRGQRGESGCTLFSDTIWETIIPAQTIHLCPICNLLHTRKARLTNLPAPSFWIRAKLALTVGLYNWDYDASDGWEV